MDSTRVQKAKTIRGLAIANICIIPAILTFGILTLVLMILVFIHHGLEKNSGLKIAAGILCIFFILPGGILSLIYANKEINEKDGGMNNSESNNTISF